MKRRPPKGKEDAARAAEKSSHQLPKPLQEENRHKKELSETRCSSACGSVRRKQGTAKQTRDKQTNNSKGREQSAKLPE